MANKKDYAIVSVISNLTNSEAMSLKAKLIDSANRIAPKAKHFASSGDGSNVAKAVASYEKRRLTKNKWEENKKDEN